MEVVVRNVAADLLSQRLDRGKVQLPRSIIEFYYKIKVNDPMVSEEHIRRSAGRPAGNRRDHALAIGQRLPHGLFSGSASLC